MFLNFHAIDEHNAFVAGAQGASVVHAKHFFTIRRISNAVVSRSGDYSTLLHVLLQYGVSG